MFDLKQDVEDLISAAGYSAVLRAFAKSFDEYAKSFSAGSLERVSTEHLANKLNELTKHISEAI